jgi:hypothetical protein
MKPVICIQTHYADMENGRIPALRQTWLAKWGHLIEHKFIFPGEDAGKVSNWLDAVAVDAPNGLLYTSFKTHRMAQWVLTQDYTHVFYIPTDCYVVAPRLLKSGFEQHDYTGYHTYDERHIGGGSGYWVSRKALDAMAAFPPYRDYEDRWAGAALAAAGIEAVHDPRYTSWEQPESKVPGVITVHLSIGTGNYDPRSMFDRHEQFLKGKKPWTRSA